MCMYAPKVCCDVLLVCCDPEHRVALVRSGPLGEGGFRSLPGVRRREGEPFGRAASRLIRAMAPPGAIRPGKVTGRVRVPAPDAPPRQRYAERRVLTAHAASPGELHPADDDAGCLEWHPYAQVAALVAHLATPDLDVFLRGYVDGWIPDGWITLG